MYLLAHNTGAVYRVRHRRYLPMSKWDSVKI
jgi:hypothetical protein